VGTFNLSAKYLSKKDSSTMLPELTEFWWTSQPEMIGDLLICIFNDLLICIFKMAAQREFGF
jgi:hypothetical protein